jgi:hypothetical protein
MTPKELETLLPHQQRVVVEKMELDGKIAALNGFFSTATFESLSAYEQGLMRQQVICMQRYSEILAERIHLFTKGTRTS